MPHIPPSASAMMSWSVSRMFLIALCAMLGVGPTAWASSGDQPPMISDCFTDGDGHIYAEGHDSTWRTVVYHWSGKDWQPLELEAKGKDARAAWPYRLYPAQDGDVFCLWCNKDSTEYTVGLLRGDRVKVLGRTSHELGNDTRLLRDSSGRMWVSLCRGVYKLNSDGPLETVQRFPSNNYYETRAPIWKGHRYYYHPGELLEDGGGRIWCWGSAAEYGANVRVLQGVWFFDKNGPERRPVLEGIPDRPYTVVRRKDDTALWIAIEDDGLYEFDVARERAARVEEPQAGAFRYVHQMEQVDGDWYVLASPEFSPSGQYCHDKTVLWHLTAHGWECLVSGIDSAEPRPLMRNASGLWVGQKSRGLILVPADGAEALRVDWRRGLPFTEVYQLAALDDDRFLALGRRKERGRVTRVCSSEDLLSPRPVTDRVEVVPTFSRLVQRSDLRIWGLLGNAPTALSVWEGDHWRTIPLPPEYVAPDTYAVMEDSFARLWYWSRLAGEERNYRAGYGRVAIFDPATEAWESFDTFENAIQAQWTRRDEFKLLWEGSLTMTFHDDGRILFAYDNMVAFHYFDGQKWHRFTQRDFGGPKNKLLPFFDSAGQACVNVSNTERRDSQSTWAYDGETGWQQITNIPAPSSAHPYRTTRRAPPPADSDLDWPYGHTQDERGRSWYWHTKDGQLYKHGHGIDAPQFPAGEANPFIPPVYISDAFLDGHGHVFLASGSKISYIYSTNRPPPETSVELAQDCRDATVVSMSSTSKSKPWYIWRFDDGEWSKPQREPRVTLAELEVGRHRFESYSLDDLLQDDPTPAETSFVVNQSSDDEIAALIAALGSADREERAAAVKILARQSSTALVMLKEARDSATDDTRWWIDAAIHRLESKTASPSR